MPSESFGFLFPIEVEQRKQNGPTMSGKAILNGKEVKIAAWPRSSKSGGKRYLSLKFEDYEIETGSPPEADDDMPF